MRLHGETDEGLSFNDKYSLVDIERMASKGRSPAWQHENHCAPWFPEAGWGMPQADSFFDDPDNTHQLLLSWVLDGMEEVGCWGGRGAGIYWIN